MGFNIKNEEVHRLARRLATRKGVSLTRAVQIALENELRRDDNDADPEFDRKFAAFMHFIDNRPPPPPGLTSDHSDMYDEDGLPIW
ncbi:MAG TPA: type II toxin-antitoxin system VapB family antitoxin [Rhizobiaceae bacterium]|nr:type II toxin-antitoxin system VapB family antitoxin [Rhizobiaceae bacterium]